ncbi:unnamed protein product, partial [Ectocarpus sp. 4 AP-2014]
FPLKNRTTIRSIAAAWEILTTTLFDNLKKLGLRSCSRFLKPLLSNDGKVQRLAWAVRWVRFSPGGACKFHNVFDCVHLDEKWFYICKQGQRYYLHEGEDLPIRKVQYKSHVIKVQRAAQRNSRNRAAGTMVTHSVEVNRATWYKEKLINNVFPDIRAQLPASNVIFAQQDNAPGHRVLADPDVEAAAGQPGGRI